MLGIYCTVKGLQDTYSLTISKSPSCTCPYYTYRANNTVQICKHLIWVYVNVIGLSRDDSAIHQVVLDSEELKCILRKAPNCLPNAAIQTTLTTPASTHDVTVTQVLPCSTATNSSPITACSTYTSQSMNVFCVFRSLLME